MNTLQIPPFCAENDYLRNYEYRLLIREQGQNWQPIVPYTVRINDNFGQNIELSDPVRLSPMIYFSMGDRPAEILVAGRQHPDGGDSAVRSRQRDRAGGRPGLCDRDPPGAALPAHQRRAV